MAPWQLHQGIPFAEYDGIVLHMDLYEADDTNAPWLVFAHGGGFSSGSREAAPVVAFAEALADQGISVASISYRLRQVDAGFGCDVPVEDKREAILWAAQDMGRAVRCMRQRGAKWIAVAGSSAGAEAALHYGLRLAPNDVDAVISFSGALEVGEHPWTESPPLLGFHGTCDNVVPFGRAIHRNCEEYRPGALLLDGAGALQGCLAASGQTALVHAYVGAGHEVCNSALTSPAAQQIVIDFIHDLSQGGQVGNDLVYQTSNPPCASPSSLPCP